MTEPCSFERLAKGAMPFAGIGLVLSKAWTGVALPITLKVVPATTAVLTKSRREIFLLMMTSFIWSNINFLKDYKVLSYVSSYFLVLR